MPWKSNNPDTFPPTAVEAANEDVKQMNEVFRAVADTQPGTDGPEMRMLPVDPLIGTVVQIKRVSSETFKAKFPEVLSVDGKPSFN